MVKQRQLPDVLHLGCGEDYRRDEHNVDAVGSCEPDEIADLNEFPWPWENNSFTRIRAEHVFEHLNDIEKALRQCQRVLVPGGELVTKWPIGLDAIADPDHERVWTWRTPEFYCGARHWDTDVGLDVTHRDVRLWSHLSGLSRRLHKTWVDWRLQSSGPGPWCFDLPATSGEFTVVFTA